MIYVMVPKKVSLEEGTVLSYIMCSLVSAAQYHAPDEQYLGLKEYNGALCYISHEYQNNTIN